MKIELTPDELREANDALSESINRMLEKRTAAELEYSSLAVAWAAQKKVIEALLPGLDADWMREREMKVQEVMDRDH